MSSGGRVVSSSGCVTRPKGHEIGSTGYAGPTQRSLLIGHCVMATAKHREPCDSRGSCTVLGAPRGEIPPGDSTGTPFSAIARNVGSTPNIDRNSNIPPGQRRANRAVSHRRMTASLFLQVGSQTSTMRRDIVPKLHGRDLVGDGSNGIRHRETRTHCRSWQRGAGMAARRARAKAADTGGRLSQRHVARRLDRHPR